MKKDLRVYLAQILERLERIKGYPVHPSAFGGIGKTDCGG
jgi:hypothetical protein